MAGNFSYEKKTPEKIHIGIMTRLMRPETLSIFCARQAVSRPTPPKATAPSDPSRMTERNRSLHSHVKNQHAEAQEQSDFNHHQHQAAAG